VCRLVTVPLRVLSRNRPYTYLMMIRRSQRSDFLWVILDGRMMNEQVRIRKQAVGPSRSDIPEFFSVCVCVGGGGRGE
jgi:hypothetical protein